MVIRSESRMGTYLIMLRHRLHTEEQLRRGEVQRANKRALCLL